MTRKVEIETVPVLPSFEAMEIAVSILVIANNRTPLIDARGRKALVHLRSNNQLDGCDRGSWYLTQLIFEEAPRSARLEK